MDTLYQLLEWNPVQVGSTFQGGARLLLLLRSTGRVLVALVAQDPSAGFRSLGSFFEVS